MSEQLLAVLKLCLLGLIYLFFLRVLSAVWVEVHGPRRARTPKTPTRSPAVPVGTVVGPSPRDATVVSARPRSSALLRVLEPAALAGRTYPLTDVTSIGRAPGCDVLLDDTYVSQVHARVERTADGWVVEDAGSTNGTYVNRAKVTTATPLAPGDRLQIGNVVLELA